MRIYRLNSVAPPTGVSGAPSVASQDDVDHLVEWFSAFQRESGAVSTSDEARIRQLVANETILIWRDPHPVSMVSCYSPTPNGIRISSVYTPPEYRNHGYASAAVAEMSQRQLDAGRTFCYLFTDLANPTSNSIYQQIGYRPVCDVDAYTFASNSQGCTG